MRSLKALHSPDPNSIGKTINTKKIIITGAAGLVGQNLALLLRELDYERIIAIDKHAGNLQKLLELNPGITTLTADLAERNQSWEREFEAAECLVILQAQITGLEAAEFIRNNVTANENILAVSKAANIPHIIQISSSVLHSKADDVYVRTKSLQEQTVIDSGMPYTILRPTLMFGWFDPKHLGWLSRLMERTPVFPIPGDGKFLRQPLYIRDFCRIIHYCIEHQPIAQTYDIVGVEDIDYVDLIHLIKQTKGLKTKIVHIPYFCFDLLLKVYALFNRNPPFTSTQLKALAIGDYFQGVNTEETFGIRLTPIQEAIAETFTDARYAHVVIDR